LLPEARKKKQMLTLLLQNHNGKDLVKRFLVANLPYTKLSKNLLFRISYAFSAGVQAFSWDDTTNCKTKIHKSNRPIATKIQKPRKRTQENGQAGLAPRAPDSSTNSTATTTWSSNTALPSTLLRPAMEGLQRRPEPAAANARGEGAQQPQRVIHCDVEPAPRAWPGMQMLAVAAILVLGGLQFLPATHFRLH
jgi:hypothetical protein